jgi:hypothetical protein
MKLIAIFLTYSVSANLVLIGEYSQAIVKITNAANGEIVVILGISMLTAI